MHLEVSSGGGRYPVIVAPGVLSQLPSLPPLGERGRTAVIVSSRPIWRRHGARLRRLTHGRPPLLIPDGERAKTLSVVSRLYSQFSRLSLDRSSVVIAFGGGVVGDVAGFAAATYLRGLPLVQVPTTLLGQVDSAIGGKVGVNLRSGKNLVGAFHAPALVVCDPKVLRTLPPREFRAGLYEVVKYGVIAAADLFAFLESTLPAIASQHPRAITRVIADCCRIKADIVSADEREGGQRRVLNFGHTIGHALEAMTGYRRFRHGEAIAHGMRAAAHLSQARDRMSRNDVERLEHLIGRVGPLPAVTDLGARAALRVIRRDKKVQRGRLHFVLAKGIGATEIVSDLTDAELVSAMRAIGMRR